MQQLPEQHLEATGHAQLLDHGQLLRPEFCQRSLDALAGSSTQETYFANGSVHAPSARALRPG